MQHQCFFIEICQSELSEPNFKEDITTQISRSTLYMIKPLIVSIRSEEPEDDTIECNPTGDKH